MQFTNLLFLFVFLPLAWLGYRFVERSPFKNLYILIVSLLFYAFGSLSNLVLLLIVLIWNFVSAKQIEQAEDPEAKKIQLYIAVGFNLLILFLYKYFAVWMNGLSSWIFQKELIASIALPVGLSFYIFSCLSYVFDVYYQKAEVQNSFVDFGVFAAFFGRINMGPIAHYAKFQDQLENHPVTPAKMSHGALLFLQGLSYKVILADNLAALFQALSQNTTWLGNLMYGFCYFFQLYFDFAGYSRMARGIGCLFGFEIPKNFNLPYTALSVQDFWRRWHISLTDWFRDYVYIPLGGNRVDQKRWILNVLCVWLLTGVWHGAQMTFIVWGLYQGALILLERFYLNNIMEKLPNPVRHFYLILTQLIGWTLFFSPNMAAAGMTIGRYFGLFATGFANAEALFWLKGAFWLFALSIIFSSSLPEFIAARFMRSLGRNRYLISTLLYIACFIVCIAFLISATSQTFLYAAF